MTLRDHAEFAPTPIVSAIEAVLAGHATPIPLHVPRFEGDAWAYVKDCLDTGWVSSTGAYVNQFEKDLARYTGAGHAVATVNGTAALHAALQVVGVRHGDEVLAPALTFVATANAIRYCGAEPHFVDVDEPTLGVDTDRLAAHLDQITERRDGQLVNTATGRRIAALMVMHTFGHPCDLDGLSAVAERFALPLIEDAAESLGSWHHDRHTGTIGRVGVVSFNGNKIVTTGGGGAILTHDGELAAAARHLTTTAKVDHPWAYIHDQVGYNYRLPNLNAALGCAELERLPALVNQKRQLADRYRRALAAVDGAWLFEPPAFAASNHWLNALVLDRAHADQHQPMIEALRDRGWLVRAVWTPMHQLAMYQDCPRMDLSVTESLGRRLINLPSSPHLACAPAPPAAEERPR
jgi:perosamine synthetase